MEFTREQVNTCRVCIPRAAARGGTYLSGVWRKFASKYTGVRRSVCDTNEPPNFAVCALLEIASLIAARRRRRRRRRERSSRRNVVLLRSFYIKLSPRTLHGIGGKDIPSPPPPLDRSRKSLTFPFGNTEHGLSAEKRCRRPTDRSFDRSKPRRLIAAIRDQLAGHLR